MGRRAPRAFPSPKGRRLPPLCKVGPQTGWLCPNDDCTPCDMYKLPDFNTELQEVRDMQFKHLEELFHIGVTGLRSMRPYITTFTNWQTCSTACLGT